MRWLSRFSFVLRNGHTLGLVCALIQIGSPIPTWNYDRIRPDKGIAATTVAQIYIFLSASFNIRDEGVNGTIQNPSKSRGTFQFISVSFGSNPKGNAIPPSLGQPSVFSCQSNAIKVNTYSKVCSCEVGLQDAVLDLQQIQLADSDPKCELDATCANYNEETLSVWYVWLLMLLFLAMILSCGTLFCLQCWLKRRNSSQRRPTLAVFALSDVNSLSVREASPSAFSGVSAHSLNTELCSSPALHLSTRGSGSPPSYEDVMKAGRH